MNRYVPAALLGCVLFCGALMACGTPPAQDPLEAPAAPAVPEAPPPEAAEAPAPGLGTAEARPNVANRDELSIVFSRSPVELDFRRAYLSSEAQIFTALYEGLFSYHPFTMEPVPALAASWTLSEDKREWTFTLREARYGNGDPVRAEDFRAAWLSLLDPARESPYSSLFDLIQGAREFRLGLVKDPARVGLSAPDDKTLVVRLNAPAAFFPSMLCHHSFSPIHPSMLKLDDWSRQPPISNGPFSVAFHSGERIELVKNDRYWDASRVILNKLHILFAEDGEAAAALWNSGEARWIAGEINLEALTDRSGIVVNPMFATHYYFIRSGRAPWQDHRIRRALSLALPWAQIREGHYLPAKTLVYPIPGYPEISGAALTDTEEAARLLAEAGYPKGVGLPELVIRLTPGPESARIGELMAAAWMALGAQVKLDVVPYEQYFEALKRNDYEVGSTTWIGDFADPYTFLQMWRRDSNLNDARYNDGEYETLMEKSMGEEGEARWKTLSEAETLLLERGVVLPVSFTPALNIVDTDELEGWFPNALDIHPFKYLYFKALRPIPGIVLAP